MLDYLNIFETTPDLYLILSPDLKIVAANNAYLAATMTKREEIVGRDLFEVFPDNPNTTEATSVKNLSESLKRVFKNKKQDAMPLTSYDIRLPGSEKFEERYWSPLNTPVLDDDKNVKYIIHRVEDVTEYVRMKKKDEELSEAATALDKSQRKYINQLKASEERFRILVESIKDYAIFMLDTHGNVVTWNEGAKQIKGYDASEIIGRNISVFYTDDEQKNGDPVHNLKEAKEKGRYENEGWRVRKDGTKFLADVNFTPLYNEKGEFTGYAKITRDLTERKSSEEAIQHLNKELENNLEQLKQVNSELESFSYSVSHDLRAPLRAINGYTKMLEEDYGNLFNEDCKRKLSVIRENAKKMGELIDDLLSLSRLGRKPVQKSFVNMKDMALAVVSEIGKGNNHKAKIIVNGLSVIDGDYSLLYQVMLNLVSNAIKYSSKVNAPVVEISSEDADNEVIYSIKDNGAGFDMQYSNKLFKVFQRLHTTDEFEGTGIGLAIVQRIVTKHGGKVWAKGEVNKGATFYFSLPKK